MAQILIDDYDLATLPDVCAKCGAPAVTRKKKRFSWHPQWVLILILAHILVYAIVAYLLTKRKTVPVPLCDEHKGHWFWRNVVIFGGLFGLGFLAVAGFLALGAVSGPGTEAWGVALIGGGVLGLIVWLVTVLVLQNTTIRPQEITDNSITLKGVAPGFAHACEDAWLQEDEYLDRAAREHWHGPRRPRGPDRYARGEDEDDPPRRREEGYRKG